MITEFSVNPTPTNNKAKIIFFGCLAAGAACTVVYFIAELYKGLIGLGAMAFIIAAVFIYTRYMAPRFYYDITFDSAEQPVFVVRQKTGKRESTLCRIDLFTITKIERETRQERRSHKTPMGYVKYVYTPTLMPEVTYRITSISRYEKSEIIIEGNDDFSALLLRNAQEAKELHERIEAEEQW